MQTTIWQGIGIGFAIAAPVGPIGMLCIRRTLSDGRLVGLATGLGAATADALYGLVAALGLGALTSLLLSHADLLRLAGGALLIWLGVAGLRRAARGAVAKAAPVSARGLISAYATTVALTLANPATILSFLGVIAALSGADALSGGMLLIAGVFVGSSAWWLLLVSAVGLLRHALPDRVLPWIEASSGLVLAGFGASTIFYVLRSFITLP